MATGQRIHLRLYLAGLEVPVISATVDISVNAPATASISIVPTDAARYILPRTRVHLFYYDDGTDSPDTGDMLNPRELPVDDLSGEDLAEIRKGTRLSSLQTKSILGKYRLLFMGDVIGWNFSKNATQGRSMVLQCMDDSAYFDAVQLYHYDPQIILETLNIGEVTTGVPGNIGARNIAGTPITIDKKLANLIRSPSQFITEHYPEASLVSRGVLNLIANITGIGNTEGDAGNAFYRDFLIRCRILDQIFVPADKNTAVKMLESGGLIAAINQYSPTFGSTASLRDYIKLVASQVFYNHVSNPAAYYNKDSDRLYTFTIKPELFFAPPPICNVVFPDEYTDMNFGRNFLLEITRLLSKSASLATIPNILNDAGRLAPTTQVVNEVLSSQTSGATLTPTKGLSKVFPHEVLTGPISSIEMVDPLIKLAKGSTNNTTVNEYLIYAANFSFYLRRFAARQASINTKFLPRVVAGLPMLVMDKPVILGLETVQSPLHIIGDVVRITHVLSAGGSGQTSVSLDKVRVYDESIAGIAVNDAGGLIRQDIAEGTSGPASRNVEDAIMPPQYDKDVLGPKVIGDRVYKQYLGCGSIIDEVKRLYKDHASLAASPKLSAELSRALRGDPSVNQCVDILNGIYSTLQDENNDIHVFINSLTYRPIARLLDIIDPDAVLSKVNNDAISFEVVTPATDTTGEVISVVDPLAGITDVENSVLKDAISASDGGIASFKNNPDTNILFNNIKGVPFDRVRTEGDPPPSAAKGPVPVFVPQTTPVQRAQRTIIQKYRLELLSSPGIRG